MLKNRYLARLANQAHKSCARSLTLWLVVPKSPLALGELADNGKRGVHSLAHLPPELFAAKIGLAELVHAGEEIIERDDWADKWKQRWIGLREENSGERLERQTRGQLPMRTTSRVDLQHP